MTYVTTLAAAADLGRDSVGGKAFILSRLAATHDVPEAFVVTTRAFDAHFERLGLAQTAALNDAELARLRREPLAAELAAEVHAAYAALPASDGRRPVCAVRSSAVDEDGSQASFAGQHATYYYVDAADLERRIVDCWLSAWGTEVQHYRQRMGVDGAPRMAVIVQLMVAAKVSGVVFTRDPTGRQRDAVMVESCWGLGAALVDGRVSPDSYLLRRGSHELLERRIGSKRFKVAEDLLEPTGTRLQPVPRHQQRIATLDERRLAEIGRLAESCEAMLGAPQDVEWAYAHDQLQLLQSRPITQHAPSPRTLPGRWIAFKPILENFTDALTPLTVDIVRQVIPRFGQFIDGRYYLDFERLKKVVPLSLSDRELVELALLKHDAVGFRLELRRVPRTLAALALAYASSLWVRSRHIAFESLAAFRDRCDALLANQRLDAVATLRALLLGPQPLAPASQFPFQLNILSIRYFFILAVLRAHLRRFAPRYDQALVASLCVGSHDMLSTRLLEALRAVARVAEQTPVVRQLLQSNRLDDLPNQLAVHPAAESFVVAFERFVADFGHRGTRELELAAPRWREDPTPVFAMIRNLIREGIADAGPAPPSPNVAALAALEAAMPSRLHRAIALWLVERIRYYVALRENTRHYTMLAFATVRAKILALEERLLQQGALHCADDIFFLTCGEIAALGEGGDDAALQNLIRSRRLRHLRRNRSQPPLTINIDYQTTPRSEGVLSGQCASPGIAEGNVRLVLDPATDGEIRAGEILVAPYTDPAWTPLFLGAAAIVVETGSYLSHAGTIARELGVPCLVDVDGATTALRNGQRLCVDATQGKAFLLATTDEERSS
jgi:rifampicin phosphotransferase